MPPLLQDGEPPPLGLENPTGASAVVLICEHAGRRIPERLGNMGLDEAALSRHIAWDIGALGVSRVLAVRFDAPLLYQRYSRLVCDCNRRTDVPSYIPERGEELTIPGNLNIDPAERQARTDEIYSPFQRGISDFLDARRDRPTVVLAVHSFTPVLFGQRRPWQVGMLYDRYPALGMAMLERLGQEGDLVVGDNEPYSLGRDTDFTVPHHGEDRGLPCLEIEWRQDLIADGEGQRSWGLRIGEAFWACCGELGLLAPEESRL